MAWIDRGLKDYLQWHFKDRKVKGYYESGTWQTSRYVYLTTWLGDDEDIHYEYYRGHVELHLEGKYQSDDYRRFANELRIRTSRHPRLKWMTWQNYRLSRCQIEGPTETPEELLQTFKDIMEIFDPLIKEISSSHIMSPMVEPYDGVTRFVEKGLESDEVSLESCSLGQIFSNELVIPDYQRNYCWEEKQLVTLWASLKDVPENAQYHLGTIILQKLDNGGVRHYRWAATSCNSDPYFDDNWI